MTFCGILSFLDQAAFQAILDIGEFHPAVADGRATVAMQNPGMGADIRRDLIAVAQQQALVASTVADDLDTGIDLAIALDQPANGGTEAWGQAARG